MAKKTRTNGEAAAGGAAQPVNGNNTDIHDLADTLWKAADGQVSSPNAIAVDGLGRVATAELSTERVQVFDLILGCTCPGDTNGDLTVNLADLLEVISNWGSDGTGGGDPNDDGAVNLADLLEVISNWGNFC